MSKIGSVEVEIHLKEGSDANFWHWQTANFLAQTGTFSCMPNRQFCEFPPKKLISCRPHPNLQSESKISKKGSVEPEIKKWPYHFENAS